jgi:hydroxypyruvate isomerase
MKKLSLKASCLCGGIQLKTKGYHRNIQNWIDYAKGIGDPSVHLLNQNTVFSPTMYKTAKNTVEYISLARFQEINT